MRSAAIRSNRSDGEIYIQAASSSDFVSIGTEDRNNLLKVNGNGNVNINYGNLDVTDGSVSATDGIFSGDIIANQNIYTNGNLLQISAGGNGATVIQINDSQGKFLLNGQVEVVLLVFL